MAARRSALGEPESNEVQRPADEDRDLDPFATQPSAEVRADHDDSATIVAAA